MTRASPASTRTAACIETDVQLVMLATPPGFRPLHLRAAVEAGKHVFAEKPVATDVAGIRSCLETYDMAVRKGLGIGVGTQRRHHDGYVEVMNRIRDGAIGEVLNGQVYWNQGGLWSFERPAGLVDTEWQIRNWLYFAWLSGDHIVEQHVHNIDVANWVMGGPPVRAVGVGGRQAACEPAYGHIYDHFAIDFEYPNGVHIMSMSRQIQGARGRNGEWFQGSTRRSHTSENGPWAASRARAWEWERPNDWISNMIQEHADLVNSIRAGRPHNDLKRMAESNLTAIMGREAAYTGQIIEYDALLAAEQDIAPGPLADIAYGALAVPPVPVPGRTQVERGFLEGWA
jgi:myo-inositol 2-dehydrogenase / D-chiro-inositol 1-dehydrogenase